MSETVLVTGGAGFIGSFLVDELVSRGDRVIAYDSLDPQVHQDSGRPSYLNPDAEFIQADIRDRDQLERAVRRADVVSHQAAVVGVGQSMYQIDRYVDVNIRGTAILLDLLVNTKHHVRKLIVPGSMSAYGEGGYRCPMCGPVVARVRPEEQMQQRQWEVRCLTCDSILEPIPTDEEKPMAATSVYAITKRNQEELTLSVCQAFGIPAVVLRYFNVYGPRQSLSNPYTGVAAIFMSRLKNNRPPMVFEDGGQSRDFVSVHDIVDANLAVMSDSRANYRVFNIGTGQRVSILEIAQMLARLLNRNIEPMVVGRYRKGDVRHCSADISRIAQCLGWAPIVPLESGMRELVDWSDSVPADDRVEAATEELRLHGLLVG